MGGRQRFGIGHVQPGGENLAVDQRLEQGFLVNVWPAGGVDEDGRRLHAGELLAAKHPLRLRREGRMHRDEVALG
jgi:hypothetical protein